MALRLGILLENDDTGDLTPLIVDRPLVEAVLAELGDVDAFTSRWQRKPERLVRAADLEAAVGRVEAALKRRTSGL